MDEEGREVSQVGEDPRVNEDGTFTLLLDKDESKTTV